MRISTRPGSGVMTLSFLIFVAVSMLLCAQPSLAANATWNGTTDALWSTGTNWSATPVPGTGDTATFNNGGGNNTNIIDLGGGVTIKNIAFDTRTASSYVIGAGTFLATTPATQSLTLDNGGSINLTTSNASQQFFHSNLTLGTDSSSDFKLGSAMNISGPAATGFVGPNGALTITGNITGTATGANIQTLTTNITGSGNIVLGVNQGVGGIISGQVALVVDNTGPGMTVLNYVNNNTFSGGVTIKSGTLLDARGNAASFGSGAITLGGPGGTADTTLIGNLNGTYANAINVAAVSSGVAMISSNTNNSIYSGPVTLNNNLTLRAYGNKNLTLSGGVTGTGNLTLFNPFNTNASFITLSGGTVNNVGTITNSGTNWGNTAGANAISAPIGNLVTGVIQKSVFVPLTLSGDSTAAGASFTGPITIDAGTVNLTGTGKLNAVNLIFNSTGSFVRTSPSPSTIQTLGTLTFNGGDATVQSTYAGSGTAGLTFASLGARSAGAIENYVISNGVAGTTNNITLTSATNAPLAFSGGKNNQGVFGDFPGATGTYARYDTTTTVPTFRRVIYGTDDNTVAQQTGNIVAIGPPTTFDTDVQYSSTSSASSNQTASSGTSLTVVNASSFLVGQALSGTGSELANNWITAKSGNVLTLAYPATVTAGSLIRAYNSVSAQPSVSMNTLSLINGTASGGASFTLAPGATLSVNGILTSNAQNGRAYVFSGGSAIQTATPGAELVIRTTGPNTNVTIIDTPIVANGVNALTKSGTGQLILNGANTYTGGTYINSGILTANNASALGTTGNITFTGGTFIANTSNSNGGTLQYTAASGAQDYSARFKNSTGTIVLDTNGQNVTLASVIDNSNSGGLTVSNTNVTTAGSLTLSAANTFSGGVTLVGGDNSGSQQVETLNINNNSALGTGTFRIVRPSSGSATALQIDNTSLGLITVANEQTWETNVTFLGSYDLTMTGLVTLNANPTVTVTAKTLEIDGAIGQKENNRTLTKAGNGTLILANANTYNGNTTINAGTLQLGNGTVGRDGSVSGNIVITNSTAAGLVFNQFGAQTYTGVISGSGSGGVTKNGAGTQTLAGANTYTGPTTVNAGTLQVDSISQATTGSLANTAITVNAAASGDNPTFAVIPGAAKTYLAGTTAAGSAGATLNIQNGTTLSPVAAAFTMADDAVETFNLRQQASFAGTGLTIGSAAGSGYVMPMLTFDIGGASLTDIDLFNVVTGTGGGTVSVGTGGAELFFEALTSSTSLTVGDYVFMTAASGLGPSANFTLGTSTLVVGSNTYSLSLENSTTTQEILTIADADVEVVPEPSTLALALLGFIGLGAVAWRRSRCPA